jgi:hypothetical protein
MSNRSREAVTPSSRVLWLLFPPCVAVLIFALSAAIAYSSDGANGSWLQALRSSAMAYGVAMAALLFVERNYWPQSPNENRFLEVLIALLGIAVSMCFIFQWIDGRSLSDLRLAAFGTASSAAFLVPQRTDRIRALAFATMAIVMAHRPLVELRPPYGSVAVLSAAAAGLCLLRPKGGHVTIRRVFSAGAFLGVMLTVMGVYGVAAAYQTGSGGWVFLTVLATLYFLVGTVVVITRGSWWERHPKR